MPTPSDTANRGSTLAVLVFIPHRLKRPIEELYSSLAQSVEHLTVNQGVVGSSPTGGAISHLSLYAPLAQLVEQLTLNQWVPGSNP